MQQQPIHTASQVQPDRAARGCHAHHVASLRLVGHYLCCRISANTRMGKWCTTNMQPLLGCMYNPPVRPQATDSVICSKPHTAGLDMYVCMQHPPSSAHEPGPKTMLHAKYHCHAAFVVGSDKQLSRSCMPQCPEHGPVCCCPPGSTNTNPYGCG